METIQLSIEESLMAEVQQATNALQMTPSDFIKVALERAVQQREIIAKERRDAKGYAEHPQQPEEVGEWVDERVWISDEFDGNSLALRIPKSLAAHSSIEQGSVVDLSLENGRMIVEAAKEQEYSLEELLAQVTKSNLHSEVDFGAPVGKEVW